MNVNRSVQDSKQTHKYSSPMSLRQYLISNSAFLAPLWGAVVCDLNMYV